MSVLKVLVVDDHPVFRDGLVAALSREPDLEIVGAVQSAQIGLEIARTERLDLAITDVMMPETTGISLAAELHALQPDCTILALSMVDEPVVIAEVLRAGANGYAHKSQSVTALVAAIRAVLAGELYLPPDVPRSVVEGMVAGPPDRPLERLTRREREVFELLIRGSTNDDIGGRLFIARRTVETHRQRIMNKLAAHSLVEMIRIAATYGVIEKRG
jgi:DNA-binding NarL/FixJ family response regulator